MAAMREIIPLVSNQRTLEWIEREVPVASWRTRGFLLDKLIYIAPVDADRTAAVFRAAIGLKHQDGLVVLDPECWTDSLMDDHAIEWSLEGKDGRRSLLREFPRSRYRVAFMLAEALQNREQPARREKNAHGFFDDYRTWTFWSDRRDTTPAAGGFGRMKNLPSKLAIPTKPFSFSIFPPSPPLPHLGALTLLTWIEFWLDKLSPRDFSVGLIAHLPDDPLIQLTMVTCWIRTDLSVV